MHEKFDKLARKLIPKNGRAMQLVETVNSGTSYDPTQTDVTYDVIGLQTKHRQEDLNNDLVPNDSKAILLDTSGKKPTQDMKLIDEGIELEIAYIEPLKPGTKEILSRVFVVG